MYDNVYQNKLRETQGNEQLARAWARDFIGHFTKDPDLFARPFGQIVNTTKEQEERLQRLNEMMLEYRLMQVTTNQAWGNTKDKLGELAIEIGFLNVLRQGLDLLIGIEKAMAAVVDAFTKATAWVKKLAGTQGSKMLGFILHFMGSPAAALAGPWWKLSPLSMFGFQSGGIVTRPTMGMVGEAGPEAIIPLGRLGHPSFALSKNTNQLEKETRTTTALTDQVRRINDLIEGKSLVQLASLGFPIGGIGGGVGLGGVGHPSSGTGSDGSATPGASSPIIPATAMQPRGTTPAFGAGGPEGAAKSVASLGYPTGKFTQVPTLTTASGEPPGGAGATTDVLKADAKNRVDPNQLYQYLVQKYRNSPLNGFVPPDGAKFGIKTGSPEEWATLGVAVARQESGFNTRSFNPKDPGGSAGLFQFGQGQKVFTGGRDQFDPQASADAFVKSTEYYLKGPGGGYGKGSIHALSATFGSIRRPHEATQHLPYAQKVASKNVSQAPDRPSAVTMVKTRRADDVDVGGEMLSRQVAIPEGSPAAAAAAGGGAPGTVEAAVDELMKLNNLSENKDKRILMDYLKSGGVNIDPEHVPWCAAIVNASLNRQGVSKGTRSLAAASLRQQGYELVRPEDARKGDIFVVKGTSPRTGEEGKHTGYVTGSMNRDKRIPTIAGNEAKRGTTGAVVQTTYDPRNIYILRIPKDKLPAPKADAGKATTLKTRKVEPGSENVSELLDPGSNRATASSVDRFVEKMEKLDKDRDELDKRASERNGGRTRPAASVTIDIVTKKEKPKIKTEAKAEGVKTEITRDKGGEGDRREKPQPAKEAEAGPAPTTT
jgi:hypothetical protein